MKPKHKPQRRVFKLDRMTAEQRRALEEMYSHGVSFREMGRRMSGMFGRPVNSWNVSGYCRERIEKEAAREAQLQQHAETIARVLGATNSNDMAAKTRAGLQAIFFNLLNDAQDESLTDVARELRELEKVDVARERVAIEQKKVQISQKQLELKNKELEARLASGREALAQVEQAVSQGHSTLPADVLAKLKEAYGIAG